MEYSLFKGSLGLYVSYSDGGYTSSLRGRKFTYYVLGGKPHLRIDMSGNLRTRNKDCNSYLDACELVEQYALLNHVEINDEVVSDFARRANKPVAEWVLELDFAEKGDFLYSVVAFCRGGKFDVRFRGTLIKQSPQELEQAERYF